MGNNIGSQIVGELGEIAKDVGKTVAQIPKDIAGKALESMGASSTTAPAGQKVQAASQAPGGGETAWTKIDSEKDQKIRRAIARSALEDLLTKRPKPKEPSIWERLQQEQEQKKNTQAQQQQVASQQLQPSSSKRPRGDMYGKKAKTTATENRNVRQD